MRRRALLVVLGMCGAAACQRAEPGARIAIHSAPVDLDPHLQNESLTSAILSNVYEALADYDGGHRVRPVLAAAWRNPDDRTWLFTLRSSVRFHDGRPLEAEDVVFSLERVRRRPGSPLGSYLVEVESVRALDAKTVEVKTRRPFAALLSKLMPVFVVPRGSPERIVNPVGTGPYRFARSDGRRLELLPSPGRGGREDAPGPLTFVVEPDSRRRLERLLAGEVDVAADLDGTAVGLLERSACCRAALLPGATIEYLHFMSTDARFRDRRVREAIHLALDRSAYVAEGHHGLGQPIGQMAVPALFGYMPALRPPGRDLARARALLAEAGYPGGLDLALEHRPGRRADVVARQLLEAGIRVTPRASPWNDLYGRLREGRVAFYLGGLISPTGETSDILDGFVHTRDVRRGFGSSNHSRFSSPRVDTLIEAAATAGTLVERRERLQQAMEAVMEDLWFVPVAGLTQVYGVRREIDFRPRLDLKLPGREIVRR